MSSEIIHTLFVACDHLIVLAYSISGPAGPNVCHPSEVEPASGIFFSPTTTPTPTASSAPTRQAAYLPRSVVSLLLAIHLSFHSLLWITAPVRWESCPNTFALPKQSIAVCLLLPLSFGSACRRGQLRRSPGEVTRGPAGQLVLIASRGLGFFFSSSCWGPASQPGCSDVRSRASALRKRPSCDPRGKQTDCTDTFNAFSSASTIPIPDPPPPYFFTPIQTHTHTEYASSFP